MITITYEELFTRDTLYKAHLQGRKCKRDKRSIVRFELTALDHLEGVYRDLARGTFRFGRYASFAVYEPKMREIQTQPYVSRIIQHVLCDNMLMPYFSKRAVLDNCVCQPGKGMHFALKRFENMLNMHVRKYGVNGYFIKGDILKYFASIPHAQLKRYISSEIADEKIRKIVDDIIDGYYTKKSYLDKYGIPYREGECGHTGRGVPIGNQTSQVFGMFYLNPLDRLVKEKLRVKVYSRYMDDFVLLHPDLGFVKTVYAEIEKMVTGLGLLFNSKTQIFPMKNGVTYLGYRFIFEKSGKVVRLVKKQTKKRMRSRARLLKKAYLEGVIPIERVRASQAAFHGHLKHGRCHKFERELNKKLNLPAKEEKEHGTGKVVD